MKLLQKGLQLFFFMSCSNISISQQQISIPKYTFKSFVTHFDTSEFKSDKKINNGLHKDYFFSDSSATLFYDTDDNNTANIEIGCKCLFYIEAELKNGKKNGLSKTYVIDSADHSRRYKIYEQSYLNDKLNGEWKMFNLKGNVVRISTYKEDSLNGISRIFAPNGKTIIEEIEYFNGKGKFTSRIYDKNNVLMEEASYENGILNGIVRQFWPTGVLKHEGTAKNGVLEGIGKYYYLTGQLWSEMIYKNGENWTVVSNYDRNGKLQEKGNLKDGNGTLFIYNEDGKLREVVTYFNGKIISKIKQ